MCIVGENSSLFSQRVGIATYVICEDMGCACVCVTLYWTWFYGGVEWGGTTYVYLLIRRFHAEMYLNRRT